MIGQKQKAGESSMQVYAQLVEDIVDEIKMRKPESDVFALIGIVEFAVRNALDGLVKSSRDDECTIKQSDWRRAAMKLLEDPNWLHAAEGTSPAG